MLTDAEIDCGQNPLFILGFRGEKSLSKLGIKGSSLKLVKVICEKSA